MTYLDSILNDRTIDDMHLELSSVLNLETLEDQVSPLTFQIDRVYGIGLDFSARTRHHCDFPEKNKKQNNPLVLLHVLLIMQYNPSKSNFDYLKKIFKDTFIIFQTKSYYLGGEQRMNIAS